MTAEEKRKAELQRKRETMSHQYESFKPKKIFKSR